LNTLRDNLFDNVGQSTKFLIGWVIALVLAPGFAFFVMRDFRRLMFRLLVLVPPDLRAPALRFSRSVDHTLRSVIRGQLVVILVLSLLYSTAFYFCGLPAGILVGLVTGLVRVVPYADLLVGGTLSFLIMASNQVSGSMYIAIVASFAIIQLLDGILLTPKIMGQVAGLHPFLIIIAVLCFGDWFGFYGVVSAIPLAAIGRVFLEAALIRYRASDFYRNV
jgi:predicted PurR-regulated permease PerM